MILYSHRGNIIGKEVGLENQPDYINFALKCGFNVEIDVHYIDDKFYLGHDEPLYEVDESYLENSKLICHAKTPESFMMMLKNDNIHTFWNDLDLYAITSKKMFWTLDDKVRMVSNPKLILCDVALRGFLSKVHFDRFYGICSDYVGELK